VTPPYSGYSNKRAVYVVTYGRSGSTLLTGYLTSLPGLVIRGENNMFPLSGFQAEQRILMSLQRNFTNRLEPTSPWYGAHHFNVRRWRKDFMKALLNQMYPARPIPKTIGFKEIRWYYMTKPEEFSDTIDWLLSLRQPAAAIFLFRNLDKVQASEWWAELTEEQRSIDRAKLEDWEAGCRQYAAEHPDQSVVVTYEDFTTDPAAAQSICNLLGVRFSEESWKAVLSKDFSYSQRTNSRISRLLA